MSLYTPQTWADGESGNTPLSAARLTVIEEGIEAASPAPDFANYFSRGTDAASPVVINSGQEQPLVTLLDDDFSEGDFSSWGQWITGDYLRIKVAGWYRVDALIVHSGAAEAQRYTWGFSFVRPLVTHGRSQIDNRPYHYYQGAITTRSYMNETIWLPGPTSFPNYSQIVLTGLFNAASTSVTVSEAYITVEKIA